MNIWLIFSFLAMVITMVIPAPIPDDHVQYIGAMRKLEFCTHVNCSKHYSNGQVAKRWRNAQLFTCCPSFRARYNYQFYND